MMRAASPPVAEIPTMAFQTPQACAKVSARNRTRPTQIEATHGCVRTFLMRCGSFFSENITMPMIMSDKWTWLMVLIFGLAIVADMVCFRFYGKHPYMIEDILKDFAEKYNRGEDYNAKQPATV